MSMLLRYIHHCYVIFRGIESDSTTTRLSHIALSLMFARVLRVRFRMHVRIVAFRRYTRRVNVHVSPRVRNVETVSQVRDSVARPRQDLTSRLSRLNALLWQRVEKKNENRSSEIHNPKGGFILCEDSL